MASLMGDIKYAISGNATSFVDAVRKSRSELKGLKEDAEKASDGAAHLTGNLDLLSKVFQTLAAGLAAYGVGSFIMQSAKMAAHTELLGVSLLTVAKNAGYGVAEIREYEQGLIALNFRTDQARSLLRQMVQGQLDVTRSTELASAAKDYATSTDMSAADALGRINMALTLNSRRRLGLMGIIISANQVQEQSLALYGKSHEQLNAYQQRVVLLNETLTALNRTAGASSATSDLFAKRMTVLRNMVHEAKTAFGQGFLPVLNDLLGLLINVLKWWNNLGEGFKNYVRYLLLVATAALAVFAAFKTWLLLKKVILGLNAWLNILALNPVGAIIMAVVIAVIALAAAWKTNLFGIQDKTKLVFAAIKAYFGAILATIKEWVGSLIRTFKLVFTFASTPPTQWKQVWQDYMKEQEAGAMRVKDAWVDAAGETKEAAINYLETTQAATRKAAEQDAQLTKEQIAARKEMMEAGIAFSEEYFNKIKDLHGESLAEYVKTEIAAHEEIAALSEAELNRAETLNRGKLEARKVALDAERRALQDNLGHEHRMGRVATNDYLTQRQALVERGIRDERALLEERIAMEVDALEKKKRKGITIGEEYNKAKAQLDAMALRERASLDKQELDAEFQRRQAQVRKLSALLSRERKIFESGMAIEEALLQQSFSRREITEEDYYKQRKALLAESQRLEQQHLAEAKAAMEARNETGGEEYKALLVEETAMNNRHAAEGIQIDTNTDEALKQIDRNRFNRRMGLIRELASFEENATKRRLSMLTLSFAQEVEGHKQMLEEKLIDDKQYEAWLSGALDRQVARVREVLRTTYEDTEQWRDEMIRVWAQMGLSVAEIERNLIQSRKRELEEGGISFIEAMDIARDEFLLDLETWADMGYDVVRNFAESSANAMSEYFFDLVKGETKEWYEYLYMISSSVLRTITDSLGQMLSQLIMRAIGFNTVTSVTVVTLEAELVVVETLTAAYVALAIAKAIAGGAGAAAAGGPVTGEMADGGRVPGGYGGGDRVDIKAEAGEFVNRKESVRYYGQDFFAALNKMTVPKATIPQYHQSGGAVSAPASGKEQRRGGEDREEGGGVTVINVFDERDLQEAMASESIGRIIVNRFGQEFLKRLG